MGRQCSGRRYLQSLTKSRTPLHVRQLGQSENQVHTYVRHPCSLENGISFAGSGGVMPAVHPSQDLIIKGLHSHADPIDSQAQKPFYIGLALLYNVIRVDLNRELVIWAAEAMITQSPYDTLKNRKGQHRWGAAAYI